MAGRSRSAHAAAGARFSPAASCSLWSVVSRVTLVLLKRSSAGVGHRIRGDPLFSRPLYRYYMLRRIRMPCTWTCSGMADLLPRQRAAGKVPQEKKAWLVPPDGFRFVSWSGGESPTIRAFTTCGCRAATRIPTKPPLDAPYSAAGSPTAPTPLSMPPGRCAALHPCARLVARAWSARCRGC
jgi:hypothetical protein